ncbi:MAG: chorismate synthase [Alphaproteobacteria bacterium]|nr:chorismate synthase [Alphaproteobacteria bacterium]
MTGSSFCTLLKCTTWGESHGIAIGCTVEGMPPRIALSEADIQLYLDRRKPGQSRYTTQRRESDQVRILSGVYNGQTTGTPIQLMIENQDQRSKDYSDIATRYRPGHADFTYDAKYGIRDPRGGGRASARETASRVAAGALARKVLKQHVPQCRIVGGMIAMGTKKLNSARDWDAVAQNPLFCPNPSVVAEWAQYLDGIRKSGSSIGALVEVRAIGIPPGLGAPVFDRLDADLAKAMMSINAVKAVEIGAGLEVVAMSGEDNADQISGILHGIPNYRSNHAGGILGGISNGNEIVVRFAIKPTSSILTPLDTIDSDGNPTQISTKGRHDPCVGIRAVPVGEAMMALVLADHCLRHRAQCGSL